jgi:hypothetical protein
MAMCNIISQWRNILNIDALLSLVAFSSVRICGNLGWGGVRLETIQYEDKMECLYWTLPRTRKFVSHPHSTLDVLSLSLSLSLCVCTVVDGRQSASFLVSRQLIIHQLHCDTANFPPTPFLRHTVLDPATGNTGAKQYIIVNDALAYRGHVVQEMCKANNGDDATYSRN